MKIGIDVRLWNQTGVGTYIRNLVYELEKIDKKNNYVLFARKKDLKDLKIVNSRFRIVESNIAWHSIEEQFKFPPILYKENLDLVHFPYHSVPITYNKPFVVTIHDLIPWHFNTGNASTMPFPFYKLKFLFYKFILIKTVKKAKKIIVPSNATKKELIDSLGVNKEKIDVTYEAVDDKFKGREKRDLSQKYFLYVGNAYPHKNLEVLINSFNLLNDEKKNIKLYLVGRDDFFYRRLARKIKNNRIENIQIFLNLNDKEIADLYKNAMAFISPSLMEGFGLTPLEAMSNGCPVLVSDIPCFREICQDSPIYFNPKDTSDLLSKMKIILNDLSIRDELIEKGIKRSGDFNWEKTAKETLEIYESSIGLR